MVCGPSLRTGWRNLLIGGLENGQNPPLSLTLPSSRLGRSRKVFHIQIRELFRDQ